MFSIDFNSANPMKVALRDSNQPKSMRLSRIQFNPANPNSSNSIKLSPIDFSLSNPMKVALRNSNQSKSMRLSPIDFNPFNLMKVAPRDSNQST